MFSATVLFPTVSQNGQLLIFYPLRQYYSSKSISPLGLYSIYVHTVLNSESLTLPSPLRNAWYGALMTSCFLSIKSQLHSCPARCPIDPYGSGYTELLGIFCSLSHTLPSASCSHHASAIRFLSLASIVPSLHR